ncbi:MAG: NAD(P)-dependent oxidoreductase [Acidobacteria bacterium]|nr:NAD(P)-dependent oxidoreductase [Acidobacteriota bacterium]
MKVAITGSTGLFGHGLVQVFQGRHTVLPISRTEADITKREEVRSAFLKLRPDVVIHAAAIPSPDVCEANPALAYLVNVHGTHHVAEAASEIGAGLAYISSDAVFDGRKQHPYTEADLAIPHTVYGRTKLRGEQIVATLPKHWIFRVSVLFGPGKANFIEKGLRAIAAGEDYTVASDQTASATYTLDAAEKILDVVESGCHGLYHLSNQGACTRYELARHAAEVAGLDANKVIGVPSDLMGRRAKRLKYGVMEMRALKEAGFSLPRPWQSALADYLSHYLANL